MAPVLGQGRAAALPIRAQARNGASNDVWMMDPQDPDNAEVVLESPDGTSWNAVEFSESGSKVLIHQLRQHRRLSRECPRP